MFLIFSVWNELISEVLSYKHYTRFVVNYLSGLLNIHGSKIKSHVQNNFKVLNTQQFLKIFDTISEASINKEMQGVLLDQYETIKVIYR